MALGTGYSSLSYEIYLCPFLRLFAVSAESVGCRSRSHYTFANHDNTLFQPANVSVAQYASTFLPSSFGICCLFSCNHSYSTNGIPSSQSRPLHHISEIILGKSVIAALVASLPKAKYSQLVGI